ncbi:alpha/beta fold hydrolase [Phyllobacterium lublinensis]|uniref:alpha/beta fold hydrolase n=1 Tax=Phyllobacterium lublinensis TaxID=2875708 RepID=UPI001CCDB99C|nr:alpha/beta hydrolase [Phyllobacterium sp. 2063]MBZ9653653.1 alpha/beta hydrolase [Phyllobacterium sp. 2063]
MARMRYRTMQTAAAEIFYRETVPRVVKGQLPIVLLHGFPSSSHQYSGLMQRLGTEFHMVAPDYPGFGQTRDLSPPGSFVYSFESISRTIEEFIDKLGLERFVLYVFDFGAPVGFRIAARRPDLIAGIIVQNANAYEAGLSDAARHLVSIQKHDEVGVKELEGLLTLEGTKFQYFTGVADPEAISPDGYTMDQCYLDMPGRKAHLIDLLLDYKSNVDAYPGWQEWLRRALPPAQILWGRKDPLFLEAGARAYLVDLPHAEFHLFDTGHFALEECLDTIAPLVAGFVNRVSMSVAA